MPKELVYGEPRQYPIIYVCMKLPFTFSLIYAVFMQCRFQRFIKGQLIKQQKTENKNKNKKKQKTENKTNKKLN